MDVVREYEDAPGILREVYRTLEVDIDAMRRHCQSGFMNAVDLADLLCRKMVSPSAKPTTSLPEPSN